MFSKIIINKQNLLHNLSYIKSQCNNAKICAMVKANAYGHGLENVVKILKDRVNAFGVVNINEALSVRKIDKKTPVIIFGACENIRKAIQNDISLSIISVKYLKKVVKTAKNMQKMPLLHLNINSGMNRFGIKTKKEVWQVIKILDDNNISLQGIFTHFSSLTTDRKYSQKQKAKFDNFVKTFFNDVTVHVGGGNSVFSQKGYDMYRVGLFLYGYGHQELKPVMQIVSQIVDVTKVKKGEYVGYMSFFKATKDMQIAVVPVGYSDGIKRALSNKLIVEINGKKCNNVGKICMDCFMVDISNIEAKVGDKVKILSNATNWTGILDTTEYEILTNFNSFRGEIIVK